MADTISQHPVVQEYRPYGPDGYERDDANIYNDFGWDDWYDDFPEYDTDEIENKWNGGSGFIDILSYFRYMLNIVFIVIPMAFFEFLFIAYNVWFNAVWNYMWANGNVWLVANSAYLLYQCIISLILALEYPLFMRVMRMFRFFSVLAAALYNFFFSLVIFEWFRELYLEDDETFQGYEPVDIMVNMFLIYNVILHFPVTIVNTFIITKEITLEFVQFIEPQGRDNDMALGFFDIVNMFDDAVYLVNPVNYWNEGAK